MLIPLHAISKPQDRAAKSTKATRAVPVNAASFKVTAAERAAIASMFKVPHFGNEKPSALTRELASQVVATGDNRAMPFIIVDKVDAKVYVFNTKGQLRGASPVLLGLARGDDSVPGIGERKIADILPEERTTPAGRFLAERGRNSNGEDIIWVDYDNAVSMHRVRPNNPAERRLQRLASPTVEDNRISYGCINVPVKFYNTVVNPTFQRSKAVVYVLPETRPLQAVFSFVGGDVSLAERKLTGAAQPAVQKRDVRVSPTTPASSKGNVTKTTKPGTKARLYWT